jgi:uncharacterized membrane protein
MITLLLVLIVIGVIVYLVENFIPMPPPFKVVIRVIAVVFVILYLLNAFGLDVPLPRAR